MVMLCLLTYFSCVGPDLYIEYGSGFTKVLNNTDPIQRSGSGSTTLQESGSSLGCERGQQGGDGDLCGGNANQGIGVAGTGGGRPARAAGRPERGFCAHQEGEEKQARLEGGAKSGNVSSEGRNSGDKVEILNNFYYWHVD